MRILGPITKEKLSSIIENIKGYKEKHFIKLLDGYRQRVNQYYKDDYSANPEYFKLMNFVSIDSIYVNDKVYDVITISTTGKDEFNNICLYLEEDELNKLNFLPNHIREKELANRIGKKDCLEIVEDHFGSIYYNDYNIEIYEKKSFDDGCNEADMDYNGMGLVQAIKLDRDFYKNLSEFNVLDLQYIMTKVKDNEFKYELEESVKAYNAELYLASAATSEIAIETLLRVIIVKKLGRPKLPRDSYLLTSSYLLLREGIIDQRLSNRIESINKLRHGIAHSATGETEKWDCEQIFALVKIIVDDLF